MSVSATGREEPMAAPAALASDSTSFMFFFLPDALARGDHPLRLWDGRIHRDAHGEVVTVLLQCRHKVGHLLGGVPLPEDGAFCECR